MMIAELNISPFQAVCDYFGFKMSKNGSVLFVENVYCIKPSHFTDLTLC